MSAVLPLLALLAAQATVPPEYEAIRKRLAQDRVKMKYLQREEGSILSGLVALERAIEQKQREIKRLSTRIEVIERRLVDLETSIAANESVLVGLRDQVGRRAAAMQRLRRTNLSALVRKAREPGAVRRLQDRLRVVLGYDTSLVKNARDASSKDRQLHAELGVEEKELTENRAALETETAQSLELRDDRAALLEAVKSERKNAERLATELQRAAKRLEQELGVLHGAEPSEDALPGGFPAQKGRLPWPVPGRVEVTFGKKVDPASGMVMAQKGIDVRASFGHDVRSVYEGKVAYASWFDGFGRLLVLEHPDGFYSLYAHLESFAVELGQRVNGQQVIGTVGDSGSTKGAYLYFEIRRGKEPVDPLSWLTR